MRFMIIVKASGGSEAGAMPSEALFSSMAAYHEELATAGVLLDASGLQPSSKGWRIHYAGGKRRVIDGPFAETKGLVAGYTLIQVRSREEAMEWSRRFPAPHEGGVDCELLAKLGRWDEARAEFMRAAGMTRNKQERDLLLGRAGKTGH